MTTPFYKDHGAPEAKPIDANSGLWYDKFCNQWRIEPYQAALKNWTMEKDKSDKGDGPKLSWIKTVTGKPCGESVQLTEARDRVARLLEAQSQPLLFYRLESDFVTGLGREHPVENGFAWHHTLGTPYLPGSSVKGVVRAWAEVWAGAETEDVCRIFGDTNETGAGSVIFLDALPAMPVQLKADIMTPHYGPYYQDKEAKTPPADWHSPNPIPFLVVEAGTSFVFGILPRRKDAEADCKRVEGWLKEALSWTGAGAKTAVGYGRFAPDTAATEEAKKQLEKRQKDAAAKAAEQQREVAIKKQTAGKSDLYIELFKQSIQNRWTEPAGKVSFVQMGVVEGWLEKLETDPQQDAAKLLGELIEQHFPGLLENPDAVGGRRNDRPVFKDRQRKVGKRMLNLLELL